jgi:transposase
MNQRPYSSDLAPCEFFLFPKLKRPMKERIFATIEDLKTASLEELKAKPKSADYTCFED